MAEVNFGFLLFPLQLLDMAGPLDVLSNIAEEIVSKYAPTEELKKMGIPIKFHHIAADMNPVQLTGGFKAQPTTTFKECPKLDYLLVGGPDPAYIEKMPQEMVEFLQQRSKEVKTLFTVCTGAAVVAAAGLLNGRHATMNHTVLPFARQKFPDVKWDESKRWVADGKYLTSAGAIAGTDMMANWVRDTYGKELYYFTTSILEFQPRDVVGNPIESMNGKGEIVAAAKI